MREFFRSYRRGVRTSLRNNSAAYGYSVVATADFAVLNSRLGSPTLLDVYLFIIGAVSAFALLEAITSQLYRDKERGESSEVVALGTAFSFVSIGTAVGVTALATRLIDGWPAWIVSAFGSTVAYLIVLGIELALADRAEGK